MNRLWIALLKELAFSGRVVSINIARLTARPASFTAAGVRLPKLVPAAPAPSNSRSAFANGLCLMNQSRILLGVQCRGHFRPGLCEPDRISQSPEDSDPTER